jgi:hypothetical protein
VIESGFATSWNDAFVPASKVAIVIAAKKDVI